MSNDESLKFNIQNDVNESVFGVVYNVSDDDLDELDKFEGVIKSGKSKGKGYIREIVKVIYNDNSVEAITYICTCGEKIDNSGENKPYSWYVKHALIGAREAELDRLYIEEYINIKSKEDGDKGRVKRELKIYS